eukprot:6716221-Prymnesium_polylepis.1
MRPERPHPPALSKDVPRAPPSWCVAVGFGGPVESVFTERVSTACISTSVPVINAVDFQFGFVFQ